MADEPRHVELDDLHETHVTHFQLTTMDNEVILSCGELNPVIGADGQTEVHEIRYDTKLRMTHETAFELKELLVQSFTATE